MATSPATDPPPLPTVSRGPAGWVCHLLLLTAWISMAIIGGYRRVYSRDHPFLSTTSGVLWKVGAGCAFFAAVCLLAWLFSRASAEQWRFRWRGGLGPIWRGFLYAIAIRVGLMVLTVPLVVTLKAFHVSNAQISGLLRPHVENAVSVASLRNDPIFPWVLVTVASCYAGLHEEIWRGGMLAGLAGAFPQILGGRYGAWCANLPTSLLFGGAHLYMGWAMTVEATLIGVALGAIMVWHRTIWDAVIAHGFFDATSFAALTWIARHAPQMLAK